MDIIGMLKEGFGMITGGIGAFMKFIGLKNTPEMQKADSAQKEADDDDEIDEMIKNRDDEEAKKRTGS